jgi:ubiquinol-cytochrome c reductase cytochrome b subunit
VKEKMMKWLSRRKKKDDASPRWSSHRFGYEPFYNTVLKRRVPKTPWYHGDGAALTTLLIIQIVTGVTMTLYYMNAADQAYDSVQFITGQLSMGWLVRGIHYWTAGTMVVVMVIHVFRHLVLGGYKSPREGTWIVGVFQFFLVLTMSFTGYLLRWDERAVYASRVVLNMFNKVPVIGEELVYLVQGGPQLGAATLTRMFSVHIWIVPLFLVGLVGFHLYLVVLHGVTSEVEQKRAVKTAAEQKRLYKKASESEEGGEWFYPQTMFATGRVAFLVVLIIFIVAAVVGPREMYPEGNLIERSMPQEEWWFWWYSSLIAQLPPYFSSQFLVLFPIVLFFGLLLLPFLDRGTNRGWRKRPIWALFVLVCIISLLWLSDLRIRSPWTGWPDDSLPPVPEQIVLSQKAELGRQRYTDYGCNSCHAISSQGARVGPDLARVEQVHSRQWLHAFVLAPPLDVPMPAYQGRITDEDLDLVVEFVLVAQTFHLE